MNKQQAQKIIRETFENPFDKQEFKKFIRNLLNKIDESNAFQARGYVKEMFRNVIKTYERIGTYYSPDEKKIDIIITYLQKGYSLDHARVTQRNFAGRYLSDRGNKNAGLFAFVSPEETDWRFSLVTIDYKIKPTEYGKWKGEEVFSQAKRWSFLVGINEACHTAKRQFEDIMTDDEHNPTLAELEKAFDIETVTKEFFLKYRELFMRTKEELDRVVKKDPKVKADFEAKGVDTVNFAKKLMGQIVFLYFLQKKGWFGVDRDDNWGEGSKHFLRELFKKKHGDYTNFFNDILEPLFYEALRRDRSDNDGYYSRFNCKIPFLNGGLFDPIGTDRGYNWVETDIFLPDKLFSNINTTKEGDTGDGILDIFDRYNFTVKEDEPLDKEVAIDPELLGKAYEKFNAIRPDNFNQYKEALKSGRKGEENKFNKKFGVYYTPREIVHYMCQQSLINYLDSELNKGPSSYEKVGDPQLAMFDNKGKKGQLDLIIEHESGEKIKKEDIETLIHMGEHVSENEETALIKKQSIKEGKQKTSDYKLRLPESIRKNAALIDEKLSDITVCDPAVGSGAFPVGMMGEIVRARNVLSTFIKEGSRTSYEFKRRCIEHSLYGVDIDPGAVEIAKLRLWLSLVVDEGDIKNIKPLPNLDYKIVCGNSLLGVEKNLFNEQLFKELERLKPLYFNETNPTKKQEYKTHIDELISQITSGHKEFDLEVYFSEVFHNKGGFDAVIANPPYVKESTNKSAFDGVRNSECYQGKMDLWYLFGCNGLNILKKHGIMCFIATNNWISNDGASKLRNKVVKNGRLINFIDFGNHKVFTAGIQTMVYLIAKDCEPSRYQLSYGKLVDDNADLSTISDFLSSMKDITTTNYKKYLVFFNRKDFIDTYIKFIHPIANGVLDKIKNLETFHLDDDEVFSGIDVMQDFVSKTNVEKLGGKFDAGTGVFVISNKEKEGRPWNRKELEIVKPYYTTKEINRYYANPINKFWVLYTGSQINRTIKNYPNIKEHLDKFKNIITSVNKPYGLHRTRKEQIFLADKIMSVRKCSEPSFSYVDFPCYVSRAFLILKSNRINLKYLLSILNSKLIAFWLYEKGKLQGNMYQIDKVPIQSIPVKIGCNEERNKLIELVDKILTITKDKDHMQNPQKQAQVKALEREIDQLVYKLYDITPEEIKIVEGG